LQENRREITMALQFIGGNTDSSGSLRLYKDGYDYVVQGQAVTEPELLAELKIPDGEAVVRVPRPLWKYLPERPHPPETPLVS
jgi:hypothetical protein